jgi:7-keto-8-aminopelargonate synthetase-like enzyme
MDAPLHRWTATLAQTGLSRFLNHFAELFPDDHLKDLDFDSVGPGREAVIRGQRIVNFGSDSFLGLDQDSRVKDALRRGIATWGSHSGASRAFAGVRSHTVAEEKIAAWLGTESAIIYPSVTLVNLGVIPGIVGKHDFVAADEFAHNSIHDGVRMARGSGVATATFKHDDPDDLDRVFREARPFRFGLVCVDGVYSMSGTLPPLKELAGVCRKHNAVLYVDDAHGTGVLGRHGVGTVEEALGCYDNVLVVGSLSKAFSCMGGFIGCPTSLKNLLKMRSNTYIFGGPVAPCYLDAICTVLEILQSGEYPALIGRLRANLRRFTTLARELGYDVVGGLTPIVALLIGDEALTLKAGRFLFDRGYYVQSVLFPAVPYHAGVLRVQVNSNHTTEQIDGLILALKALRAYAGTIAA